MVFNGWAVSLNGVTFTTCSTQVEWDELDCAPASVYPVLDEIPQGLHPPALRTEDVVYPQRDGSEHFMDWYTLRMVIVRGTFGPTPTEDCETGDCQSVREQVMAAVQAWKRTQIDTELVVFTDCYLSDHDANYNPPDEDGEWFEAGGNLAPNPSAETEEQWDNIDSDLTVTWDTTEFYAGTKSRKSEKTSGTSVNLLALDDVGETDADQIIVSAGLTYTFSIWLMVAQAGYSGGIDVAWPGGGTAIGEVVEFPAGVWTRVTVTGSPGGSGPMVNIQPYIQTTDFSPATVGHVAYADALLVEQSTTISDYYDGDTDQRYNPTTEQWERFSWTGDPNESTTLKETQAATFHGSTLNGPFGIVGRPREFIYTPPFRDDQVVPFVARFDAVDQRMYVLDECGTPGFEQCVEVGPGSQILSLCPDEDGNFCPGPNGWCFTESTETGGSVDPTDVAVAGTERVYPTITLFPGLDQPRVENITTGEWVSLDGVVSDVPVTINTEEGTAFDSEGNSLTHLLRGNLFLSMDPGNYQWRLLATGETDPTGYMTLCLRPTVVAA